MAAGSALRSAWSGASGRCVWATGPDALRQEGVKVAHVSATPDRPTGVAGIVVDAAAQNCILSGAGRQCALSPEDVRAAGAAIRSADVVVAQLEVPLDAVAEAFALAAHGPITSSTLPRPVICPTSCWR